MKVQFIVMLTSCIHAALSFSIYVFILSTFSAHCLLISKYFPARIKPYSLHSISDGDGFNSMTTKEIIHKFINTIFNQSETENKQARLKNRPATLKSYANEIGLSTTISSDVPSGKDETWRHTNVRKLFTPTKIISTGQTMGSIYDLQPVIAPFIDSECKKSCLVFIDGVFCKELSSQDNISQNQIDVSVVNEMDESHINYLRIKSKLEFIPDSKELVRDSFASNILTGLNLANVDDILSIAVKENAKVDHPIQVLHCSTMTAITKNSFLGNYPRFLIELGKKSSLQLKQSYVSLSPQHASIEQDSTPSSDGWRYDVLIGNTQVVVGDNATFHHTYLQEVSESSRHLDVVQAKVETNASYKLDVVQIGGLISRINLHVDIVGSLSNSTVHGVNVAAEKQSQELRSSIVHDVRAATSRQQQRNVIGSKGEVIFKGRIRIPKHAQLTDSAQLCRSIMLGEGARLIAMPTLEITADNIECSHGASVSDLDENALFYLSARGVDRKTARKLLLRSFAIDLLSEATMDKSSLMRIIGKLDSMNPELKDDNFSISTGGSLKYTSI